MEHSPSEEETMVSRFLGDDILVEILCKLPDESLVRFKSVSKAWDLLISELCIPLLPSLRSRPRHVVGLFLRTYVLKREPCIRRQQYHHLSCYFTGDVVRETHPCTEVLGEYASLEGETVQLCGWEECLTSYGLPFKPKLKNFLGCCNGLLLFIDTHYSNYYVSNPSTRQCVSIPLPPITWKVYHFAALAFDPSRSTCYRVVRFECPLIESGSMLLDIYSSTNKSWKRHSLQLDRSLGPSVCIRATTYFDGALFRLTRHLKVLRFDLEEVSARGIQLPLTGSQCEHVVGCVGVLSGQLSYGNQCYNMVHIWSLEKSEVWSLRHRINICDLCSRVPYLNRSWGSDNSQWVEPVAFHPSADVVYLGSPLAILSYDLVNHKFEQGFRNKEKPVPFRNLKYKTSFLPGSFYPAFPYVRFLAPFTEAGDIRSCSQFIQG